MSWYTPMEKSRAVARRLITDHWSDKEPLVIVQSAVHPHLAHSAGKWKRVFTTLLITFSEQSWWIRCIFYVYEFILSPQSASHLIFIETAATNVRLIFLLVQKVLVTIWLRNKLLKSSQSDSEHISLKHIRQVSSKI